MIKLFLCSIFLCLPLQFGVNTGSLNEVIQEEIESQENNNEEKVNYVGKTLIEKNGFGTGFINVSKFRKNAVVTTEYGQIIAYFRADGVPCIALCDDTFFRCIEIVGGMEERLLGDGHCSINIGYSNGRVWYAYGAHANYGYWGSFDIRTFVTDTYVEAKQMDEIITYPQFYNVNNDFYMFYRNDKSGQWAYIDLNESGKVDFLQSRIITDGNENLYLNDIAFSDNGQNVGIVFVERLNGDGTLVRNGGIYAIWSSDGMQTWHGQNGERLSLPVNVKKAERIITVTGEENLMNQESCHITDEGVLYFTRLTDDENGIPQIYLSVFDYQNRICKSYVVSNNTMEFDLVDTGGTLQLFLSRADVLVSESYIHVVYRQGEHIIIASANREEMEFTYTCVDDIEVGVWEPNYDVELWKQKNMICLFVQNTSQGQLDILLEEELITPVYLYYWKEK